MLLMIAGCSYSAVSIIHPGTSWSEILAQKLGWNLLNLARQGCSNGGIRIQIDEILRRKPDFAVVMPTFWDRMEIPARSAPFDWNRSRTGWAPDVQKHLWNRSLMNGYDRSAGIDNVNYGHNDYRMICETIYTLAENFEHPYRSGHIDLNTQTAIRYYIDSIYDSNWKKQQDEWIIREGIFELHHSGINFLFVPALLWPFDPAAGRRQWRNIMPITIPDRCVMWDESQSPLPICGNNPFRGEDPGYHSGPQGQEIIAENWFQRIRTDFNL